MIGSADSKSTASSTRIKSPIARVNPTRRRVPMLSGVVEIRKNEKIREKDTKTN